MRILHVSLGLPPLRSGGLTRYCVDLMNSQLSMGHEVCLLFPGSGFGKKPKICHREKGNLRLFELKNPLPLALTYGVDCPNGFIRPCDESIYKDLLETLSPDIIHVHSIMGIHKEFFLQVRNMNISMVYTTHDTYSICLRSTFVNSEYGPCWDPNPEKCARCNYRKGIPSFQKMIIEMPFYEKLKETRMLTAARRMAKERIVRRSRMSSVDDSLPLEVVKGYSALMDYNHEIVSTFSMLLCNSGMSKRIYERFFPEIKKTVIYLTHAGITNNSASVRISRDISIGYAGGKAPYKGLSTLIEASDILRARGITCTLHLFGGGITAGKSSSGVICHNSFEPSNFKNAMQTVDVFVVPSICSETFSFVALESLCAGVPVVCSDRVGAADLIPEEWVFEHGNAESLADAVSWLIMSQEVDVAVPNEIEVDFAEHTRSLFSVYEKIMREEH